MTRLSIPVGRLLHTHDLVNEAHRFRAARSRPGLSVTIVFALVDRGLTPVVLLPGGLVPPQLSTYAGQVDVSLGRCDKRPVELGPALRRLMQFQPPNQRPNSRKCRNPWRRYPVPPVLLFSRCSVLARERGRTTPVLKDPSPNISAAAIPLRQRRGRGRALARAQSRNSPSLGSERDRVSLCQGPRPVIGPPTVVRPRAERVGICVAVRWVWSGCRPPRSAGCAWAP